MLISYRARLAYLAAPKTASTAIEACLRPDSSLVFQGNAHTKHMNVREYDTFVRPMLRHFGHDDIELCAMIRNPVDWARSWFKYRQRDEELPEFSTRGIDFNTFIDALLSDNKPTFTHYIGTQRDFVTNVAGIVSVEHLYRHDDISNLMKFLEERFEKKLEIQPLNVSPKVDAELSPEYRARLEKAFAADFELYESLG